MPKATHVIHFHDGSMDGDCSEANILTSDPKITFKKAFAELNTVKGMKRNWHITDEDPEDILKDFIECNSDDFVGAWVIPIADDKKVKTLNKSMGYPGGDSAAYERQAMMKAFYKAYAVRRLGKAAK